MRGLPERSWSPGHGRCRSAAAGRRGGHWSNGTVTDLFLSGARVGWRCVRLPRGFPSPKQRPGGERPWVSDTKASGHTVRTRSPALARSSPVVRLAAGPPAAGAANRIAALISLVQAGLTGQSISLAPAWHPTPKNGNVTVYDAATSFVPSASCVIPQGRADRHADAARPTVGADQGTTFVTRRKLRPRLCDRWPAVHRHCTAGGADVAAAIAAPTGRAVSVHWRAS